LSIRYLRRAGVDMAPLHGETVLFDPRSNRFCVLNRTGAALWSQLETGGTPEDLAAFLCQTFEGLGPGAAQQDVAEFLAEMTSLDLVVPADPERSIEQESERTL